LTLVLYGYEAWSLTLRQEHIVSESVSEQGVERNTWAQERLSDRRLDKTV
jgi:hypothetical protein